MRAILALLRANALQASSYKVRTLLSLAGTLVGVVPLYFISRALQSTMADVIRGQGQQYFGFLLVGMITFSFVPLVVRTLPTVIGSAASNGTLELVFGSPTSVPSAIMGMMSYGFLWSVLRAVVLILFGTLLGAAFDWGRMPTGLVVLLCIIVAHVPFGLMAGGLVLAFRTAGPLPQAVMVATGLLGGVYYPTHVIPSWLEYISLFLPLTYGLRALRRVLLDGASLGSVSGDLGILLAIAAGLWVLGVYSFRVALAYARRTGSLGYY